MQHAINKTTVSGDLSAYDLAHISDFNSLIAISQQLATPVFSISDQQIRDSGQFGHALNTMKSSRDAFNEQFKGAGSTSSRTYKVMHVPGRITGLYSSFSLINLIKTPSHNSLCSIPTPTSCDIFSLQHSKSAKTFNFQLIIEKS